jgi:predicted component of type VI protein secretion system
MKGKANAEAAGLPVQGPHWHRHSPVEPPAAVVPLRLVLQSSGYAFELTRPEVVVGRHSAADVRLPLPDVSRRHCRFVFAGDCWQVFDLNSLNGLFVNGERVKEAVLQNGDIIRLGGFTLVVDLHIPKQTIPLTGEDHGSTGSVGRNLAESLPRPVVDTGHGRRKAG